MGQEFYLTSNSINKYDIHGSIASNDKYRDTLNLAYYLDVHYFGRATNSNTGGP